MSSCGLPNILCTCCTAYNISYMHVAVLWTKHIALNVLYITHIYIYKCTRCTTQYVAVDYVALGPFHTNWDDRLLAKTSTTLSYNPFRFTLWNILHCIGYAALHVSLGWVALLCMHGEIK